MDRNGSPTVRRRRLAALLRQLRENANLSREQVAAELLCSPSKIAHMEQGRYRASLRDVRDLAKTYGVAEDRAAELMALAKQTHEKGWWHQFGDVVSETLDVYVGFEAEANVVHCVDIDLVPGLLQTANYARGVVSACSPYVRTEDVDRRVAVRVERQQRFMQNDALHLWTVVDEAALRRQVGGPAVMQEQLEHLVKMANRPNIKFQMLPYEAGAHAAMGNSFRLLEFSALEDPSVVYIENLTSGLYLEKPEDIARYRAVFDDVRALALGPRESVVWVRRLIKEMNRDHPEPVPGPR